MKKTLKRIGYLILSLLVIGCMAFFAWASFGYDADKKVLSNALKNRDVSIENTDEYISVRPFNYKSNKGYIFYPGAKVQPEAYISKLSAIAVSNNIEIFIPKMYMNLAFFGINKAGEIQKQFPKIIHWYIGGHSLGGSMACVYASKNNKTFDGILIFGTYSGTDISKELTKVRSINGEQDGVFPPEKIKKHKGELPNDAQILFVKGMNHADIGNYGFQSGDNPSKLTNNVVTDELVNATKGFFE
ncbi:hypothetical protein ABIB40_001479 [Pedobacter sp. UYP30]|uniref:alpha/beta hydrolase n=1 Tax=Pedobacter sp. UYP30 TaxID=1756400 RepID=UPI0033954C64